MFGRGDLSLEKSAWMVAYVRADRASPFVCEVHLAEATDVRAAAACLPSLSPSLAPARRSRFPPHLVIPRHPVFPFSSSSPHRHSYTRHPRALSGTLAARPRAPANLVGRVARARASFRALPGGVSVRFNRKPDNASRREKRRSALFYRSISHSRILKRVRCKTRKSESRILILT